MSLDPFEEDNTYKLFENIRKGYHTTPGDCGPTITPDERGAVIWTCQAIFHNRSGSIAGSSCRLRTWCPSHQVGLQGPVAQHDYGGLLEDFHSCANTKEDLSSIEHSIIYIRTSWCPYPENHIQKWRPVRTDRTAACPRPCAWMAPSWPSWAPKKGWSTGPTQPPCRPQQDLQAIGLYAALRSGALSPFLRALAKCHCPGPPQTSLQLLATVQYGHLQCPLCWLPLRKLRGSEGLAVGQQELGSTPPPYPVMGHNLLLTLQSWDRAVGYRPHPALYA